MSELPDDGQRYGLWANLREDSDAARVRRELTARLRGMAIAQQRVEELRAERRTRARRSR